MVMFGIGYLVGYVQWDPELFVVLAGIWFVLGLAVGLKVGRSTAR